MKKMIVPVLLLLFLCACTRASEKNRTDIAVYGEPQAVISMPDTQAGFDAPDAVLTGPETRSSSPVRILRGADFSSVFSGLYPCGEGAGYAGGITSAAVDGMRCAEAVIRSLGVDL